MKIISWNTNGLRATVKQGYFEPLFNLGADIICFQETKCEAEQLPEEVRNPTSQNASRDKSEKFTSYFSHSKGRKGYSGVAIYTKIKPTKVEYGIGIPEFDDEGRTLVLYFDSLTLAPLHNNGEGKKQNQKWILIKRINA